MGLDEKEKTPLYIAMVVHDYTDRWSDIDPEISFREDLDFATVTQTACRIDCLGRAMPPLYGVHDRLSNLSPTELEEYHAFKNLQSSDGYFFKKIGCKYSMNKNDTAEYLPDRVIKRMLVLNAINFKELYINEPFTIYKIIPVALKGNPQFRTNYLCVAELKQGTILREEKTENGSHWVRLNEELIANSTIPCLGEISISNIDLPAKLYTDSTNNISITKNEKKEEKSTMKNLFSNIKFGKAGSNYALTFTGTIAFKGKTYVNNMLYDAQDLVIPFDMLFLVPTNTVAVGDVIEQNGVAYHITSVTGTSIQGVNLETGTIDTLAVGGIFGMTMYSKVFNPMGNMLSPTNGGNGFGNILMMQALMGDNEGSDKNSMLMAMMLAQSGFTMPQMTPNLTGSSENK